MRLIDADELKKAIKKELPQMSNWGETFIPLLIDNAPTVPLPDFKEGYKQAILDGKTNFSRPQGEWIIVKDERYGDNVKCPFCGKELAGTDLNFCCKCGAKLSGSEKMKGGAE